MSRSRTWAVLCHVLPFRCDTNSGRIISLLKWLIGRSIWTCLRRSASLAGMAANSQTAQRVIDTYHQAASANRATEARCGNVIRLSPKLAEDVLITADLHGQRLNFRRLVRIAALDEHPKRHVILQEVLHGGPMYPGTQGCMSHLLLEDVAKWKVEYPQQVHFLLSNHELSECTDFPIAKGGKILNVLLRFGMLEQYGDAVSSIRDAAMQFVGSCPLAVQLSNGIFVCHGSPNLVDEDGFDTSVFDRPLTPDDLRSGGAVFRLVWGRDFRAENAAAFAALVGAKLLIHGHEPCADGYAAPNPQQIILDCCSQNACFLLLSLDETLTHQQLVQRIQPL
jgi:hypothetical protein